MENMMIRLGAVLVLCAWLLPPAQAADNQLVVLGYGGNYERVFKTKIIPAFEKAHDVKVIYVGGVGSTNLAKVKLQASRPETDVLFTSPLTQLQGEAFGLFDSLDPNIVTNLKVIHEGEFRRGGMGVSFGRYVIGIAYNTRVFKEKNWPPPVSWYDLFRPEVKGRMIVQRLSSDFGTAFLALMTKLEGGNEKNAEPGFKILAANKGNILTFASGGGDTDNLFRQSEAWIGVSPNNRTYPLKDRGVAVEFVLPRERGILMTNEAAVTKGAPNREMAQKFVNHLLSPASQLALAENLLYAPTNREVQLDASLAARVPHGKVENFIQLDWEAIQQSLSAWVDRWNREIERK